MDNIREISTDDKEVKGRRDTATPQWSITNNGFTSECMILTAITAAIVTAKAVHDNLYYEIEVKIGDQLWFIDRNLQDFLFLNDQISQLAERIPACSTFAALVSSLESFEGANNILTSNTNCGALNIYLADLIGDPHVWTRTDLVEFLDNDNKTLLTLWASEWKRRALYEIKRTSTASTIASKFTDLQLSPTTSFEQLLLAKFPIISSPQIPSELSGAGVNSPESLFWTFALFTRCDELLKPFLPTAASSNAQHQVFLHLRDLIGSSLGLQLFPIGNVVSSTFLPDDELELSLYSVDPLFEHWYTTVHDLLSALTAEPRIASQLSVSRVCVQLSHVKHVQARINNVDVIISANDITSLYVPAHLAALDAFVGRDHLFKRSVLLIRAWTQYESPKYTDGSGSILYSGDKWGVEVKERGGHGRLSTVSLNVIVTWVFHLHGTDISHPVQALGHFLRMLSTFDWNEYALTVQGPVRIHDLAPHRPLHVGDCSVEVGGIEVDGGDLDDQSRGCCASDSTADAATSTAAIHTTTAATAATTTAASIDSAGSVTYTQGSFFPANLLGHFCTRFESSKLACAAAFYGGHNTNDSFGRPLSLDTADDNRSCRLAPPSPSAVRELFPIPLNWGAREAFWRPLEPLAAASATAATAAAAAATATATADPQEKDSRGREQGQGQEQGHEHRLGAQPVNIMHPIEASVNTTASMDRTDCATFATALQRGYDAFVNMCNDCSSSVPVAAHPTRDIPSHHHGHSRRSESSSAAAACVDHFFVNLKRMVKRLKCDTLPAASPATLLAEPVTPTDTTTAADTDTTGTDTTGTDTAAATTDTADTAAAATTAAGLVGSSNRLSDPLECQSTELELLTSSLPPPRLHQFSLQYAELMVASVVSQQALVHATAEILANRQEAISIGELGKLLCEASSGNKLSKRIKRYCGGLKKVMLEASDALPYLESDLCHQFNPMMKFSISKYFEYRESPTCKSFMHSLSKSAGNHSSVSAPVIPFDHSTFIALRRPAQKKHEAPNVMMSEVPSRVRTAIKGGTTATATINNVQLSASAHAASLASKMDDFSGTDSISSDEGVVSVVDSHSKVPTWLAGSPGSTRSLPRPTADTAQGSGHKKIIPPRQKQYPQQHQYYQQQQQQQQLQQQQSIQGSPTQAPLSAYSVQTQPPVTMYAHQHEYYQASLPAQHSQPMVIVGSGTGMPSLVMIASTFGCTDNQEGEVVYPTAPPPAGFGLQYTPYQYPYGHSYVHPYSYIHPQVAYSYPYQYGHSDSQPNPEPKSTLVESRHPQHSDQHSHYPSSSLLPQTSPSSPDQSHGSDGVEAKVGALCDAIGSDTTSHLSCSDNSSASGSGSGISSSSGSGSASDGASSSGSGSDGASGRA